MIVFRIFTLVMVLVIFSPLSNAEPQDKVEAKNSDKIMLKENIVSLDKIVPSDALKKDLIDRIKKIDSIYESLNAGESKKELCKKINEIHFRKDSVIALFEHFDTHPNLNVRMNEKLTLSSEDAKKKTAAALASRGLEFCGSGLAELSPESVGNKTYLAKVLGSSKKGNMILQEILNADHEPNPQKRETASEK